MRMYVYRPFNKGHYPSPEARDLLFLEWACRISENFNGMGPDFKEMVVRACLRFAVISYTTIQTIYTNRNP
jgi:hypothetical protein